MSCWFQVLHPQSKLSLNIGLDAISSVLLESPQNQINVIFNQKHSFDRRGKQQDYHIESGVVKADRQP